MVSEKPEAGGEATRGLPGLRHVRTGIALVEGDTYILTDANPAFAEHAGPHLAPPGGPVPPGPLRAALDRARRTGRTERVRLPAATPDHGDPHSPLVLLCLPLRPAQGPPPLLLLAQVLPDTAETDPADADPGERPLDDDALVLRYQALLSAVPQVVWTRAPDGRVTRLSGTEDAGRIALPLPGDGEDWLDAVHPKDRERFTREWHEATAGATHVTTVVRVRVGEDPRAYRHLRLTAVPVARADGRREWVGTVADAESEWFASTRERLLARMAEVSTARDLSEAFRTTAAVVVPDLADSIAVFEVQGATAPSALAARAAVPAERVAFAPDLPVLPPLGDGFSLGHMAEEVLRDREPRLVVFPAGAPPEDKISPVSLAWLREAGATSLALLPVLVDGRVVALASVANCLGNPPPAEPELRLLQDVLQGLSRPLRRTLELQRARETALVLQRSFLTAAPDLAGAEIRARYVPANAAAEVGGDWYDATRLAGGAVALSIGDVAGHDLDAATAMGSVNSMLRGLAWDAGPHADPARTLDRLDGMVQGLGTASLITTVHALLCPAPGRGWHVTLANAGHPPPLLLRSAGPVDCVGDEEPDPPLCTPPGPARSSTKLFLAKGDTLLLYTDGLVEIPEARITDRIAHLRHRVEKLHRDGQTLEALVRDVVAHVRAGKDDIAVIAFRATG
ncbi:SpoIIE family protein phosphatase [Streptomyces sp. GZWMJZ-114]|uniref:SpoIIE family protein phosphatase n=1 Tax=Streptomyces sp. GZWMJZ-114 TaxID=2494734 RepID=UPI001013AC62|nr:SpoIIE family protein phosphatase [Streptomyces sp. GZWMJZ-114]